MSNQNKEDRMTLRDAAGESVDLKYIPSRSDVNNAGVHDSDVDGENMYGEVTPRHSVRPPTPHGRPPVAPGSNTTSSEPLRSILRMSHGEVPKKSSHSSKCRVSFRNDDDLSEPALCFWTTKKNAPGTCRDNAAGEGGLTGDVKTPSNDALGESMGEPSLEGETGRARSQCSTVNSLPEVSVSFFSIPPFPSTDGNVGETMGFGVSSESPCKELTPDAFISVLDEEETPEVRNIIEDTLVAVDVSVSDLTGSPPSDVTQVRFLESVEQPVNRGGVPTSCKHNTPAATWKGDFSSPVEEVRALYRPLDMTPTSFELYEGSSTSSDGETPTFLPGKHPSTCWRVGALPAQKAQEQVTLIGSNKSAVVCPAHAPSPIPVPGSSLLSSHSPPRTLPLEKNTNKRLLEGGVDPDDLVLDDALEDIIMAMRGAEHNWATVEVPCNGEVIRCPAQLYPNLAVQREEGPHAALASLVSTNSVHELLNGAKPSGHRVREGGERKVHHQVNSTKKTATLSGPALRGLNASKLENAAEEDVQDMRHTKHKVPPDPLNVVEDDLKTRVVNEGKSNQSRVLAAACSSTADDSASVASTSRKSDQQSRIAKPVAVECVNKLSAVRQEALCADDNNNINGNNDHLRSKHGSSSDDMKSMPHHENTGKCFRAFLEDQSSLVTDMDMPSATGVLGKGPSVSLSNAVKQEAVLLPKSENVETIFEHSNTLADTTTSSAHSVDHLKPHERKKTRTNSETYLDVTPVGLRGFGSCESHLMRAVGHSPSSMLDSGLGEQHVYYIKGAEASRAHLETKKNGVNDGRSSGGKKQRSRVRRGRESSKEINMKRVECYEMLRCALLLLSGEDVSHFSKGTNTARPDRPSHGRHPTCTLVTPSKSTVVQNDGQHQMPSRRILLPPPPSPSPSPHSATAEGLIHTPEHRILQEPRDMSFASTRSMSPLTLSRYDDNGKSRSKVLAKQNEEMPEFCVNNCKALRTFARDVGGIVAALRNSNLVKMF